MNNKASPLAIAHRGASGEYPENTMIAFTKAIEMGADVLEVDFMRTKDGYIIVMHDTTLDRTTDCTGTIANLNYVGYIEDCKSKGEPIPLLKDMLNLLEDNASINALFDIKNSDSLTMELLCKEVALHSDLVKSRITVGTWSISGIEFSASMCAGSPRSYISSVAPSEVKDYDVLNFNLNWASISTSTIVDRAHANGQTVYAWTIDSESQMRDAINFGVDGVVTNYPDRFLAIRDGKENTVGISSAMKEKSTLVISGSIFFVLMITLGIAFFMKRGKSKHVYQKVPTSEENEV